MSSILGIYPNSGLNCPALSGSMLKLICDVKYVGNISEQWFKLPCQIRFHIVLYGGIYLNSGLDCLALSGSMLKLICDVKYVGDISEQ